MRDGVTRGYMAMRDRANTGYTSVRNRFFNRSLYNSMNTIEVGGCYKENDDGFFATPNYIEQVMDEPIELIVGQGFRKRMSFQIQEVISNDIKGCLYRNLVVCSLLYSSTCIMHHE